LGELKRKLQNFLNNIMSETIEKKEGEEVKVEGKKEGEEKAPEAKTKTAEELKAEAEAVEAEIKAIQEEKKDDELASNQARRLEKAREKLARLKSERAEVEDGDAPAKEDIKTRDLITLAKHDIPEDSEKAKILNKYKKGGIIKDFAEGLTHPGVKAEFDALDAKSNAKSVINENDSDDVKLKTRQEVIAQYKASGEVPEDPALRKEIAEANLKEMGI
jgi:hypothetical protein